MGQYENEGIEGTVWEALLTGMVVGVIGWLMLGGML
jgi:hypothetical protein